MAEYSTLDEKAEETIPEDAEVRAMRVASGG